MIISRFVRHARYAMVGFAMLGCMLLAATAHAVDIPPSAQLRLQMGVASEWGQPGAWVLETPGVPGSTTTILGPRQVVLKSKCVYDKAASENPLLVNGLPSQLVELEATGGNGDVGVDPNGSGQGVFNGSRGTDCWRIQSASNSAPAEFYKWKIGKSVKDKGFGLMVGIFADVEVKGNAVLKLDVTANSSTVGSFFLATGSNVGACIATVTLGPLDANGDSCVDGRFISQCFAGTSDSNPDSNDNCRWNIELDQNGVLGDGFVLTALSGEATLGGGNDFGVGATGTIIQLASGATGPFGCDEGVNDTTATVTNPATGLSCEAVRQQVGACTAVPYVIRADTGACELIAVPRNGEQLVANVFVKFDPETQQSLNTGETLADLGSWKPADLSQISFGVGPNASANVDIPPCLGVTLIGAEDPAGPLPIPEFNTSDRTKKIDVDRVPGGSIEFACAFKRTETFTCDVLDLDQDGFCNSPKTIVEEGIQFWGDAQFSRD